MTTEMTEYIRKYNNTIENISLVARLVLQVSISLGVIIIVIYCGKIGYYPTGLTIGDTLFFIVSSCIFTFIYTVFFILMLSAGIAISPLLRWLQVIMLKLIGFFKDDKKTNIKIEFPKWKIFDIPYVLIGYLVIFFMATLYVKDFELAHNMFFSILTLGVFHGFLHTKPRLKEYNIEKVRKMKMILALMAYSVPLIFLSSEVNFFNISMKLIGVRTDNGIVLISKRYTDFLSSNKITAFRKNKGGEGIYEDVIVLFRGVGDNVLIKVQNFKLTVPSKEIIIGVNQETRGNHKK